MNLLDRYHPLQIAARDGSVCAGTYTYEGRLIRVNGSACARLARAGAVTVHISPDGGRMYRITDLGRQQAKLGML